MQFRTRDSSGCASEESTLLAPGQLEREHGGLQSLHEAATGEWLLTTRRLRSGSVKTGGRRRKPPARGEGVVALRLGEGSISVVVGFFCRESCLFSPI